MAFLIANMPPADRRIMTAEALVETVELAHDSFDASPWRGGVPESVFREAVLPYAHINERRDDWRAEFVERFRDVAHAAALRNLLYPHDGGAVCEAVRAMLARFAFDPAYLSAEDVRYIEHRAATVAADVFGGVDRCRDGADGVAEGVRAAIVQRQRAAGRRVAAPPPTAVHAPPWTAPTMSSARAPSRGPRAASTSSSSRGRCCRRGLFFNTLRNSSFSCFLPFS